MRKVLLLAVVLASLGAAPASAAPFTASLKDAAQPFARTSAVCGCVVQFTGWYTHNSYGARGRVLDRMARRISLPWRKRFNQGVYDYENGGYGTKKNWCKRNVKACRAVIACVAAAGGYLVNAPKVMSQRERAKGAAKSCAVAATAAMVAP